MLNDIVAGAPVFLLVAARCFALIMTLPLFSSKTVPRMAKIALAGGLACFIFPRMSLASGAYSSYSTYISSSGNFSLEYVFLLLGEALIGIVMGFFIQIIFAAFSTAGQFFAFQMGFSASEVYDALSQVENPLMGQFLNFVAMLIFLQNRWFATLFAGALETSFKSLNVFSIIESGNTIAFFMTRGLTLLFRDALVIALPIMATLFLINVTMGILSKAAPQMNLLSEGFPILILTAFYIIVTLVPQLCEFFVSCFAEGFRELEKFFLKLGGSV